MRFGTPVQRVLWVALTPVEVVSRRGRSAAGLVLEGMRTMIGKVIFVDDTGLSANALYGLVRGELTRQEALRQSTDDEGTFVLQI